MHVPLFKVTVKLRKRHYSVPLHLFHETLLSMVSWALLFIDLEINWLCGTGQEVSAGILLILVETSARYKDCSLPRKRYNQILNLFLIYVEFSFSFHRAVLEIAFVPLSRLTFLGKQKSGIGQNSFSQVTPTLITLIKNDNLLGDLTKASRDRFRHGWIQELT